jgi:hypothetical protein
MSCNDPRPQHSNACTAPCAPPFRPQRTAVRSQCKRTHPGAPRHRPPHRRGALHPAPHLAVLTGQRAVTCPIYSHSLLVNLRLFVWRGGPVPVCISAGLYLLYYMISSRRCMRSPWRRHACVDTRRRSEERTRARPLSRNAGLEMVQEEDFKHTVTHPHQR